MIGKIVNFIGSNLIPINSKRRSLLAKLFPDLIATTICSIDSPSINDCDIYPDIVISGWAIDYNGIAEVRIYCDGVLLGLASYGSKRIDVASLYPRINNSLESGFQYVISNLCNGVHTIGLEIVTMAEKIKYQELEVDVKPYENLIESHNHDNAYVNWTKRISNNFKIKPLIGIIVYFNNDFTMLDDTITSICEQGYCNVIVYLVTCVDDIPIINCNNDVIKIEKHSINKTERVKQAITDAGCSYIMTLKAGDVLHENALFEFVKHINMYKDVDLIYADHREYNKSKLVFKPGWSVELILTSNYIQRGFLIKPSFCDLNKLNLGYSFDDVCYDALLEIAGLTTRVFGVQSVVMTIRDCEEINISKRRSSIESLLMKNNTLAKVTYSDEKHIFNVRNHIKLNPKISIIIPTLYSNKRLLQNCIKSIIDKTHYDNYEIIVIDTGNSPDIENDIECIVGRVNFIVVRYNEIFNWSRVNNIGAERSSGDYFIFLNDDVEVIADDWIEAMLEQAQRDDVCAVGGKLLYSKGTIQHAGILLVDHGGGGRHYFLNYPAESEEYFSYLNIIRQCSAVTGACMMMSRKIFDELDGFDEKLRIEGNDTDYCLRGRQQGYKVIWTPFALLYHHEQSTRKEWCVSEDAAYFWERWRSLLLSGDYFYNRNLNLETENIAISNRPVYVEHFEPTLPIVDKLDFKTYIEIPKDEVSKILLIKLDHIGDVILSLPAVRMIRNKFPSAEIAMMVAGWIKPVIEMVKEVDTIIEFDAFHKASEKGIRELSLQEERELKAILCAHKFDVAIDLRRHAETRGFLKLSGAKYTVGYETGHDDDWMSICLKVPDEVKNTQRQKRKPHTVAQLCQLVSALDLKEPETMITRPCIALNQCEVYNWMPLSDDRHMIVGIHAGAGSFIRQWPYDNYARLIELIIKRHNKVYLYGGPDDVDTNDLIRSKLTDSSNVVSLAGKLSLVEFMNSVKKCDIFIGNNSGPSHIAAMLNVPTLNVFPGQILPHEWQPFADNVLTIRMKTPCSPCYFATADQSYYDVKCLKMLAPERVYEAMEQLVVISGLSEKHEYGTVLYN